MKPKSSYPFLYGKKVFLRKLLPSDAESKNYLKAVNCQKTTRFLEGVGIFPQTKKNLKSYINQESQNTTSLLLGIFKLRNYCHVGNIHISRINFIHKNANYGIMLFDGFEGQGYAFEASNLLIHHCFCRIGLRRIQMHCTVGNRGAIKLYQRLGAVEEGTLRQAFFTGNEFVDMKAFAILNSNKKQ